MFRMTFRNGWSPRTYETLDAADAAARELCPLGFVGHDGEVGDDMDLQMIEPQVFFWFRKEDSIGDREMGRRASGVIEKV